ncbi:pyridoxamine 5'-phosphate oxidase [Arsenophonus symbiont of Ornithomya chloropus]|uniref:pyridoxamine 5'-phosphate oxidase n=1 Tax=Arsenophonus symbiont of Ornithomya chloropus TaxID=634121 RepID=UPI0032B2613F
MLENTQFNISNCRREYSRGILRRQDLTHDPLILFDLWMQDAYKEKLIDPTAMSISTVDNNGQPYQRIVLLKHYDKNGLIFYTNLFSRKSQHIIVNNHVSVLFPWCSLERQVCFLGTAKKLSSVEVIKYFYSRPKDSQIAAWISPQSEKISSRDVLEKKFLQFSKIVKNSKIPVPSFWGGYRIKFNSVEFWQGGNKRLHDRFIYIWKSNHWEINRLAP